MMFPNPDIIESAVLGSNLNSCEKYSKPNRFGPDLMCSDRFEPYSMSFDLAEIKLYRETWGVYRDRRPDQYSAITTLDGKV